MKEKLEENKDITANSKQIQLLKEHFPQCFDKNGAFRADKMQEIVGEQGLDVSSESYSLNWLGKSYARLLANENPLTLLKENKEHNQQAEHKDSQNLLIKGDNLEVLKHMVNAYREKVKMIYIDPPYNTGSDGFVYQDDRKFTPEQLVKLAGVELDEAKRILDFTQRKANSHSAWLTFMYPRLYIARQLLKDDGVIFISIDDNEQVQLKLLCDEVFGEENFVGTFIIKSTPNARNYGHMGKMHEYCLMYAKNTETTVTYEEVDKDKEFKFEDEKGEFNIHPLYNSDESFHSGNRPNLLYPFYLNPNKVLVERFYEISLYRQNEDDVEVIPPKSTKNLIQFVWRWGKEKSEENINAEIIGYKNDDGSYRVVRKMRHTTKIVRSMLLDKEYSGRRGTAEVEELMGGKFFSFPKPLSLLDKLIEISTRDNDSILDFFSGSGTTAHAVMALNAEDGGNRQHISVQLAEPTDKKSEAFKAGYQTIFEITQARIEKAAAKIREDHPDYKGDLGFKLFETSPVFAGYLDDMENLNNQTELFDGGALNDEQLDTLLTTWRAYDGFEWAQTGEWVTLSAYKAYLIGDTLYALHAGFDTDDLKELLRRLQEDKDFAPKKLILFGYNFESKHLREIKEALKQFKNKKSIEIDCEVRH